LGKKVKGDWVKREREIGEEGKGRLGKKGKRDWGRR
jgi:hypothetical protein